MKHIKSLLAALLLLVSTAIFATDEHTTAALQHANAALEQCKTGDAKGVAKHASVALEHALAASITLSGTAKTHMEAASKELEEGINHGNLGHAEMAGKHVKTAIEHIQASQK